MNNLFEWFRNLRPLVKIGLICFIFILILQLVGLLSLRLNRDRLENFTPWAPEYSNFAVPPLARWDSGWYVAVVNYGYFYEPAQNSNAVFFPLYPLLIKTFSYVLPFNLFWIAQVISWLALFGALWFWYKLMRVDYDEQITFRSLFLLLLFPWAFFFAAAYTESLFLFLVLASFYFARKQNWLAASVIGLLAATTRITGIFLLPALLWEYYSQRKKIDLRSSILLLIPAGLLAFMAYLKFKTGYYLAFLYNQSTYGRNPTNPLRTLWWDIRNVYFFFKDGDYLKAGVYALTLLMLAMGIYLLIKKYKQIRPSYLIFGTLSLLLPLLTGTTTSLGRYLLSVFPIFITAALVQNKFFKYAYMAFSLPLLIILAFAFVGWYFVV